MDDVKLILDDKNQGAFFIEEGNEQLAEMTLSISAGNLAVYHTEVAEKAEGKGLAKKLLLEMVDYARKNGLKVIPLCPFVLAQFQRHPDQYADIWNKQPVGEE